MNEQQNNKDYLSASNYVKANGCYSETPEIYYAEYGNVFGAAVFAAITIKDFNTVKRFLHLVPDSHIDLIFAKYQLTPEIAAYFLQHRKISVRGLNQALFTAYSNGDLAGVQLMLKQPGVHVLYTSHFSSILSGACFRRLPEMVEALVSHLVKNTGKVVCQSALDLALLETAQNTDSQWFFRELTKQSALEKENKQSIEINARESLRIATILVEAGANVHVRNEQGTSVLDLARQCIHMEPLIAYLEGKCKSNSSNTTSNKLDALASPAVANWPIGSASLSQVGLFAPAKDPASAVLPQSVCAPQSMSCAPAKNADESKNLVKVAVVSENYNIEIKKDYTDEMKQYLTWLNDNNKRMRNNHLVSKEARLEIEDNKKYSEYCCKLSLTIPDVPVFVKDDEDVYDLAELEKLLDHNNGRAMMPGNNNPNQTFTREDIRKGTKFQIKFVDFIRKINEECDADQAHEDSNKMVVN